MAETMAEQEQDDVSGVESGSEANPKKASKKQAKARSAKTKSKPKAGSQTSDQDDRISVAGHARASVAVRRAKAWGGLAGFVIAGGLSLKAAVPVSTALERALLFGVIGYLVLWGLSILVWRQLIVAEQRAALAELERRFEERREQAAEGTGADSLRRPRARRAERQMTGASGN